MNIGVDIRVLARGTRTGVEEYTINLLSRLLGLETKVNYRLFYNAFNKADLDYPWLSLPNVKLKDFRIPNRLFFASSRYLNRPRVDRLLGGIGTYFNPHFFLSPVSLKCRKVVTFHDLSFVHHPEFFSWRKRIWQKSLVDARKEAIRANRIIAVSESTKGDLINLYKIKEEKIEVIYSGVGEQFRPIGDKEKKEEIRKKYNLPQNFILYFGTIEPRKNIVGLIKAFEVLREKEPIRLVIAGTKGWLFKDVFRAARESKYRKEIAFTGFVDEKDKPFLYSLADVFVYPSFFEGFGFPPLEAMACGIPTIVSNNSSLPEVAGEGAIMINPKNIDEIALAMETALTDSNLRRLLKEKGLLQAKRFSWDRCARETLRVLKNG